MGKQGFTLMEMLVVIGIIAIVTVSALPSLRGIYREFKINQTTEETSTLIAAYRSYYLIMNEFPTDTNYDTIRDTKADWCLPRSFYTISPHKFSVKPYKGGQFDFEQWTSDAERSNRNNQGAVLLNLRGISDAKVLEKYKEKFSNLYPNVTLKVVSPNILGIIFPEITAEVCSIEAEVHRNRYH